MLRRTVKTFSCLRGVPPQHLSVPSACFRIMELCHILFKVRLIRGDSEPLICCHDADVFILSVTMALLCVGLALVRCTRGRRVTPGRGAEGGHRHGREKHKEGPADAPHGVKPVTGQQVTPTEPERCDGRAQSCSRKTVNQKTGQRSKEGERRGKDKHAGQGKPRQTHQSPCPVTRANMQSALSAVCHR